MSSGTAELFSLFYDFAVCCGFGFAAGFVWQLLLGKSAGSRRRITAIVISLFYGAALSLASAFFILGRTGARALRWYTALGLMAGIVLWRLGGWPATALVLSFLRRLRVRARSALSRALSAALRRLKRRRSGRQRAK